LKRRKRTKKIPQSQSVFAVSLQEHPELLKVIIALLGRNVKDYYQGQKAADYRLNLFATNERELPRIKRVGNRLPIPPGRVEATRIDKTDKKLNKTGSR